MTAEIVFVRHAPVREEWQGRCYGRTEATIALSPDAAAARIETALTADGLAAAPTAIHASPRLRCSETARALAHRLSLPLTLDERLSELDHGDFEGERWDTLHAERQDALARWGDHWLTEGPPNGESALTLQSRVEHWLDTLPETGTVIALSHAGVLRALRVTLKVDTWNAAMSTNVPHLTPIRLAR